MRSRILLYSFVILLFAACTPAIEEPTSTIAPSKTSTSTPTASQTPTPTSTITPSPTNTSSPTPTPTIIGGFPGKYLSIERDGVTQILVLRNIDGKLIERVFEYPIDTTDNRTDYSLVRWSPTGTHFAVLYWQNGGYLHVFEADGTEIYSEHTNLNFYGGYIGQANWSPDGKYLAYLSNGNNYYVDVYLLSIDDLNPIQLTNTYSEDNAPYFSHDNSRIFYGSDAYLYVMSIDGSDKKQLTHTQVGLLDLSFNDRYAIYYSPHDLYMLDLESNETTRLTTNGTQYYETHTYFSPDAKWIIYADYGFPSQRDPRYGDNLYSMSLENPAEHIFLGNVYKFLVSPDGQQVYYYGSPEQIRDPKVPGSVNYYRVNFDGTGLTRLSWSAHYFLNGYGQPSSSPVDDLDPELFNYSTPQPSPTPVPTWVSLPTPPLYDTFDGDTLNNKLWRIDDPGSLDYFSYEIADGVLRIDSIGEIENNGIGFRMTTSRDISSVQVFEARLKIARSSTGDFGFVKTGIDVTNDSLSWATQCRLGNGLQEPSFLCDIADTSDGYNIVYTTKNVPISYGQWYVVRIEFQSDTGSVQYYLDGNVIDTYSPDESEGLIDKHANFKPVIGVWIINGTLESYIDDVRISDY